MLVFRDITERKITEAAIQRQAELIDLSPDAIIVKMLDGNITFWSKGAEKLYGWTEDEAIGQTTDALFKTRYSQPLEKIFSGLKTSGHWSGELLHTTKNGQELTVQSWWLVEKTEEGEIISILESNVDLTQRKKAEKEIERLATFPALNPNPVFEVDFNGNIKYANPATKTLFPDLETLGLKHPFLSDWQDIVKDFESKTKNTSRREVKVAGHWYYQQLYLVSGTHQIRIYTVDIDELKQAEEARARAQVKLEENAVMLEEYASQMEELANQRAEQLKDSERMATIGQTAGMVGHDIRNPLQAITGDLYLLKEELKGIPEGENRQAMQENLGAIDENITYINKIVSDLQDYTRPLKPNIEKLNLKDLIDSTLIVANVPEKITTQVIADENLLLNTEATFIRRVLTNLIVNAIQAMPNGGKLTIEAHTKKDKAIISVKDTGVGIPEEVKPNLFKPLFTTKSKGQGLGLAVIKRLVEDLNGKVNFESEEDKGTKFIIELPQKE